MSLDNTSDGWTPTYIPQDEVWRAVVTHPGYYEISSEGRVRTVERQVHRGVVGVVALPSKVLAQTLGGRKLNYLRVMLKNPQRHAYIHHLVAEAFIGPRPEGCEVLHGPAGSLRNTVANIRYGTREENDMDCYVANISSTLDGAPF